MDGVMAWSSGLRARWWAALNYAGGAGVIVLGASGGATHGAVRVVLIIAAAGVGVVQLVAAQRRERATTRIAEETRTVTNNAMSNAFTPLLALLAEFVVATGAAQRARLRAQLRTSAVYAASLAIGPEQGVRACLFEADDPDEPRTLTWTHVYAGRADEPTSVFTAGTTRGDEALTMLRDNTFVFSADTETEPPAGWQEHPHAYRTFLAVPVHANGRSLGMLTVDSLTAGDLDANRDKPILDVLARILAVCTVQETA
jgi:GAF domain-containing protein